MKGQRVACVLDEVAAHVIPGDVDLWPTIQPKLRPRGRALRFKRGRLVARVQALAVICVAFAVIFAVSPEVRAQGGEAVRMIGQMIFRDRWPLPSTSADPKTVVEPAWPRGMRLDEAKTLVPFAFSVPTWAPDGYVLNGQVSVVSIPQGCTNDCKLWQVSMLWQKPLPPDNPAANMFRRDQISLRIASPEVIVNVTDLTTLEELTINGRPTALIGIYGPAPAEPRNPNLTKGLQWIEDNHSYMLIGGPGVAVDDLIRMAESIP
jgi:hypothetical protein